MKLQGLSNLGQTLKPQTAAKGTSAKDTKVSSFEDVLGKERSLRESTERAPKNEIDNRARKPEQERAEMRRPEVRSEQRAEQSRPEPKRFQQERSESQSNSQSSNDQGQNRADSRTVDSQASAQASDTNMVEGESLNSGTIPGQGLPPSVTNPLNDRIGVPSMAMGQGAGKTGILGQATDERGVDSLTRRVVWNDFLRKMKDEFGVSAEDVLQAFGSLSDEELAQPPSASVDKVVMALGLNEQQSVLAKQYFQDLIAKTQSRSIGEELSGSAKQINLSLMTERELQRKAMDRSLSQMNSSFFMNGPNARPVAPAMPNMETPITPNSVQTNELDTAKSENSREGSTLAALTRGTAGEIPNLGTPSLNQASTAASASALGKPSVSAQQRQLDELTAQMKPADAKDKSLDQLLQKFMQGQAPLGGAKGMSAAAAAPAVEVATAANAAAAPASPTIDASVMNGLLAALDADSANSEDAGQEFSDASYLNAPITATGSKLDAPLASAQDFQTALGQVKPGAPMAVPDLVQQAQLMVRDGGGEMKVTLNQDGLGEVAMRVNVQDGKVNVQMITESDEAKKLIERGLGELKSSLHSSNLQVSDIKIDTASNLGKQLEQQYQDAQRQQTQSGWEQFRQDNQGWRRGFFEVASAREYKGQSEAPRDVQAPSGNARRAGAQRLNLVA